MKTPRFTRHRMKRTVSCLSFIHPPTNVTPNARAYFVPPPFYFQSYAHGAKYSTPNRRNSYFGKNHPLTMLHTYVTATCLGLFL